MRTKPGPCTIAYHEATAVRAATPGSYECEACHERVDIDDITQPVMHWRCQKAMRKASLAEMMHGTDD